MGCWYFEQSTIRGWLGSSEYRTAGAFFERDHQDAETGDAKGYSARIKRITESQKVVEKHNTYEADVIQIVAAKHIKASGFYTTDKKLSGIASKEGVKVVHDIDIQA
uniref:PIN domain-containing protein n=1 Tax=Fervidicoccus fontis TaxID=683846 RepID=A0A7J3ZLL4_9CREN